jgi:glycosyltransferase involved in cell wall biosynthesis
MSTAQRLRVLRVITRMNVGGPASQVATLARGLDQERFEQALCAGYVDGSEADHCRLRTLDLDIRRIPALGRAVRPGDDLRALAGLVREIRRFRPHIVHTHLAKAGVLGRVAAAAAGVPASVHTFHGHLLHGYFSAPATRLVVTAERILARFSERLVAVGDQVRTDLVAAGIGHAGQYEVVPPGTELPPLPDRATARRRLRLPADGPVVVYVGRITAIKRPDRLIAVARSLAETVPGVTLVVCGGGDRLDETVRAAGGLRCVRFLGWRQDLADIYAAADVALLTSDNEGTPVSLIEAGLAGVPSVATRVGSVPDVVLDGVTGLLTSSPVGGADQRGIAGGAEQQSVVDELAANVRRLLANDALRQHMAGAARAVVAARFSPGRLVADTDRLYTDIAISRGWWPESARQDCPQ